MLQPSDRIFEDAGNAGSLLLAAPPGPRVSSNGSNGITRQRGDKRDGEGLQWH